MKDDREFLRFNQRALQAVEDALDRDDRFAVAAHALVMPASRKVFFEYVRSGPKIDEYIAAVQISLREHAEGLANLGLAAAPQYAGSFAAEIRELQRVRRVKLELVRPNIDWADEAERLHEFADESNARRISVEATAPARETLNPDRGIVEVVVQQAEADMSHLSRALVEGQRPGESGTTTLRSDDHVRFERATVDTDSSGSAHILSAKAMMQAIARKINRPRGQ